MLDTRTVSFPQVFENKLLMNELVIPDEMLDDAENKCILARNEGLTPRIILLSYDQLAKAQPQECQYFRSSDEWRGLINIGGDSIRGYTKTFGRFHGCTFAIAPLKENHSCLVICDK